ncbi:unnamed protein product [Closterium sp. NIES-64]|nr:unnamed protein product [Closterium sp. NIES-64]
MATLVSSLLTPRWATRNAAARLAVRRHLPTSERAHFSQYKSAQTLYDAVVARYSSPATAALSRLMLQYLFPDLAAFPTVADLITHLRTSDTRYRAALPAEFCAKNPPPPWVFPLPSFALCCLAAAADLVGLESVGAASTPSGKRRSGKGKGGKGAGGASGGGGGGGGGSGGGWGWWGSVAGVEVSAAAVEEAAAAAAVAVGAEVVEVAEVEEAVAEEEEEEEVVDLRRGVAGGGQRQQQQCSREILSPQQLREWQG